MYCHYCDELMIYHCDFCQSKIFTLRSPRWIMMIICKCVAISADQNISCRDVLWRLVSRHRQNSCWLNILALRQTTINHSDLSHWKSAKLIVFQVVRQYSLQYVTVRGTIDPTHFHHHLPGLLPGLLPPPNRLPGDPSPSSSCCRSPCSSFPAPGSTRSQGISYHPTAWWRSWCSSSFVVGQSPELLGTLGSH